MQYNNTTDKNGIIQRNEALCSIGDGGISGDTILLKQFTGLNNQAYFEIWSAQMSVDRNFRSDDFNYTDLPDSSITMVSGQADYTLPVAVVSANVATFLRLKGVYFLYNGVRTYLTPMDETDTLTTTSGEPTKYQLNGKSIIFQCPLSAATLTKYSSVFHIEYQRVPDAFLYDDTTQQPGFLETYHDLIPLRSSALYLLPIDANLSARYDQQFYERLENFKRDIAMMDDKRPRRMIPAQDNNE